jgi:prepilin-type N-terminal cleavage/methylation domain-containing protein
MSKCSVNASRAGFSLIELLVVIFIIAIVIAIVVPALGAARNTAKKQETANLISTLQQAAVQFQLDKRRAPGYFTAAEMGSNENGTQRGMSGMQNAMLDLAGGIVSGTPAGSVQVGPLSAVARQISVDPTLIGAKLGSGSKAYFAPAAKFFKKQDGIEGGTRSNSAAAHAALPELVDSWGMPILYWQLDTAALGQVTQTDEFARDSSGASNAPTIARFYWNSNRAILESSTAGFKRVDQNAQSLLGGSATDVQRSSTLTGILGSPGSPGAYTAATALANILPTAGRGSFVIHAAGSDGVYLGRSERGGTLVVGGALPYGLNFRKPDNTPHTDSSGKQISIDLGGEFDDTILGGN